MPKSSGMKVDRGGVLAAYVDGVRAVEAAAAHVRDWSASTPCAGWRAVDLAGHVLAIARYYHRLLDAAEAGTPLRGLPRGAALQAMNVRDLDSLAPSPGPHRIKAFVELADDYGRRLDGLTG